LFSQLNLLLPHLTSSPSQCTHSSKTQIRKEKKRQEKNKNKNKKKKKKGKN
jgi:hypothetical protein